MSASLPIARPVLDEEEVEAAARAIRSGWVTQGPEVAAFEAEFCASVGAPHAIAVANCTAALHLALRALDVRPGDEVICPSHSFIATANAIRHAGAVPVFVDVEPHTYNLDPARVEAAVSDRVKAILVVHQLGMPADLSRILPIAQSHGLRVIEDAACAIGSAIQVGGQLEPIGAPHGDIACFSFHPRKVITTGDGGMLTTRNSELAGALRRARQHGMSIPDTVRHSARDVVFETYDELGFNYRMTDIQAAVGRVQLRRLPSLIAQRRRLAEEYCKQLSHVAGVILPVEPPWARTNWQSFCVRIAPRHDQRRVMQRMLEAGIATRRAVMNAHRERAYGPEGEPCRIAGSLTVGESIQDTGIVLPLFHEMNFEDIARVVQALAGALDG